MSMKPPLITPLADAHGRTSPDSTAAGTYLLNSCVNLDRKPLDLFDQPVGDVHTLPSTQQAPIDPGSMSDGELLQAFTRGSLGSVDILAQEILWRWPGGWEDAAALLWERFVGFGAHNQMPEQVAVLELVRQTAAASLLLRLLLRAPIDDCLDPYLLPAAAACGVRLPRATVLRGLGHSQPDVRAAAVLVAAASRMPVGRLHPLLSDPVRDVRLSAAKVIAEAGDTAARAALLREMRLQPDRRGLEALSSVGNEDVIIWLGQIARQHHAWREIVIGVLHMIDDPKAMIVAAGLQESCD